MTRRYVPLLSCWLLVGAVWPVAARAQPGKVADCQIGGTVRAGGIPLPGVVITLTDSSDHVVGTTSSGPDGTFTIRRPSPGTKVRLSASLAAFAPVERTLGAGETC